VDAKELYALYREQLESEGVESDPWEELEPSDQIAWGKLYRTLVGRGHLNPWWAKGGGDEPFTRTMEDRGRI
jgi:hypothetical protein